jgi:hypothetical protein
MSTNNKADWLHVRMTTELSNRVKDRADSVGVTTSEWARRVLELAVLDANLSDTTPMITAALENVMQATEVHAFQARYYSLVNYHLLMGLFRVFQASLSTPDVPDPRVLSTIAGNAAETLAAPARARAFKEIKSRSDIPQELTTGEDNRKEDHDEH